MTYQSQICKWMTFLHLAGENCLINLNSDGFFIWISDVLFNLCLTVHINLQKD